MRRRVAVWSVVAVVVALGVYAFVLRRPGSYAAADLPLAPPFEAGPGETRWLATLPGDALGQRRARSELAALIEGGRQVGRALVFRPRGAGEPPMVAFEPPDGSDPNINGRVYAVRLAAWLPTWFYLAVLLGAYAAASVLAHAGVGRLPGARLQQWGRPLVTAALSVALVQAFFWVVTEAELAGESIGARQWYARTFAGDTTGFLPGAYANYVEHPYLNYALNPAQAYGDKEQFNAEYRIRRSEPVRPRQSVRWRALVLGGSTTFGEGVMREEDTWVHRLEGLVRTRYGDDHDVINGGVGGYTVIENLIHYVTLLSSLDPDVVILHEGINDVHPRLVGDLVPDYTNYRVPWHADGRVLPTPPVLLAPWYPYRYYYLRRHIRGLGTAGIGGLVSRPTPPPRTWEAALERNGPGVYRAHLADLIRIVRAQGRRVAIVPQYFSPRGPSDRIYAHGVTQHNDVNRALAEEFDSPFADAIIAPGTFAPDDTSDNCHLNAAGGAKMARLMLDFLVSADLLGERAPRR
jgi:lysophospholipase L1-like esterase